ncbi:hypothetical protein JCM10207_005131 [Rhodosporidiobolus poonsookiae]
MAAGLLFVDYTPDSATDDLTAPSSSQGRLAIRVGQSYEDALKEVCEYFEIDQAAHKCYFRQTHGDKKYAIGWSAFDQVEAGAHLELLVRPHAQKGPSRETSKATPTRRASPVRSPLPQQPPPPAQLPSSQQSVVVPATPEQTDDEQNEDDQVEDSDDEGGSAVKRALLGRVNEREEQSTPRAHFLVEDPSSPAVIASQERDRRRSPSPSPSNYGERVKLELNRQLKEQCDALDAAEEAKRAAQKAARLQQPSGQRSPSRWSVATDASFQVGVDESGDVAFVPRSPYLTTQPLDKGNARAVPVREAAADDDDGAEGGLVKPEPMSSQVPPLVSQAGDAFLTNAFIHPTTPSHLLKATSSAAEIFPAHWHDPVLYQEPFPSSIMDLQSAQAPVDPVDAFPFSAPHVASTSTAQHLGASTSSSGSTSASSAKPHRHKRKAAYLAPRSPAKRAHLDSSADENSTSTGTGTGSSSFRSYSGSVSAAHAAAGTGAHDRPVPLPSSSEAASSSGVVSAVSASPSKRPRPVEPRQTTLPFQPLPSPSGAQRILPSPAAASPARPRPSATQSRSSPSKSKSSKPRPSALPALVAIPPCSSRTAQRFRLFLRIPTLPLPPKFDGSPFRHVFTQAVSARTRTPKDDPLDLTLDHVVEDAVRWTDWKKEQLRFTFYRGEGPVGAGDRGEWESEEKRTRVWGSDARVIENTSLRELGCAPYGVVDVEYFPEGR